MLAEEALEIHCKLWSGEQISSLRYRGRDYPVTHANDQNRSFVSVHIDTRLVITQNMRKPSRNTDWVNSGYCRQLTWIIKDEGGYIGKIEGEMGENDQMHYRVYTLNPDTVVLER